MASNLNTILKAVERKHNIESIKSEFKLNFDSNLTDKLNTVLFHILENSNSIYRQSVLTKAQETAFKAFCADYNTFIASSTEATRIVKGLAKKLNAFVANTITIENKVATCNLENLKMCIQAIWYHYTAKYSKELWNNFKTGGRFCDDHDADEKVIAQCLRKIFDNNYSSIVYLTHIITEGTDAYYVANHGADYKSSQWFTTLVTELSDCGFYFTSAGFLNDYCGGNAVCALNRLLDCNW